MCGVVLARYVHLLVKQMDVSAYQKIHSHHRFYTLKTMGELQQAVSGEVKSREEVTNGS